MTSEQMYHMAYSVFLVGIGFLLGAAWVLWEAGKFIIRHKFKCEDCGITLPPQRKAEK